MEGFEIGDIVYLKSGSPKLTVEALVESVPKTARVTWITEGGVTVKSVVFPYACLTKTEPRRTS